MAYDQEIITRLALESKRNHEIRPGGLILTKELIKSWPINSEWLVIDLGCGMGSTVHYIQETVGCQCLGVDQSEAMILAARRHYPKSSYIMGIGEYLPFENEQVDAVIMECSLSVMDDPLVVLSEVKRILKCNGHLAISDLYLKSQRAETLQTERSPLLEAEWMNLLKTSGYKNVAFQDRSYTWRSYIAQMIWENGEDFCCNPSMPWSSLKGKEIGYFALTAEK